MRTRTNPITFLIFTSTLISVRATKESNEASNTDQPLESTNTYTASPSTISSQPITFTSPAKQVITQVKSDAHLAISAFADAIHSGSMGNSTTQSSQETSHLFQSIIKGGQSFLPLSLSCFFSN